MGIKAILVSAFLASLYIAYTSGACNDNTATDIVNCTGSFVLSNDTSDAACMAAKNTKDCISALDDNCDAAKTVVEAAETAYEEFISQYCSSAYGLHQGVSVWLAVLTMGVMWLRSN